MSGFITISMNYVSYVRIYILKKITSRLTKNYFDFLLQNVANITD